MGQIPTSTPEPDVLDYTVLYMLTYSPNGNDAPAGYFSIKFTLVMIMWVWLTLVHNARQTQLLYMVKPTLPRPLKTHMSESLLWKIVSPCGAV